MRLGKLLIIFFISQLAVISPLYAGAPVNVTDYPSLNEKQIGHVRHMINLANKLDGDWSMMGNTGGGMNFDAYQFQIAFAAYALAVTQDHFVPAHRDLYQDTSARLIKKMMYKDVWDYWAQMSKGEWRIDENGEDHYYTEDDWFGWIDPNIKQNIMYSGHLLQMLGLHESLFDDDRYDKPGSLTFNFAPVAYGESPLEIVYDHSRLATVIYDQFVEDDFRGIECERNKVYTECNQHPILGLIHYDYKHGTSYAPLVQEEFKKTIINRGYVHPDTHTTMLSLDVHLDEVIHKTYAWSDGWNGLVHHAWDKEYVEALYDEQVKLYMPQMLEGEPGENMGWTASFDFGWLAVLAAEVGDAATVNLMLEYADQYFNPTWLDGGYYYPHTSDYKENFRRDDEGKIGNISPVTGNYLVGFARLMPKDGMWSLYNRTRDNEFFAQPYVDGVDYSQATVSQAYYDSGEDALIVTIVPSESASNAVTFAVNQLEFGTRYQIFRDGESIGIAGSNESATAWNSEQQLIISNELDSPHSYVIVPASSLVKDSR
ncbi:MAG: hypothetical protein CMO98_07730 [Woeseia sp.]|nr:hypothetical protein [Woeseia sp.]|tara:strand:+ start:835 stop:2460 length:1626 start_codon:yes stop_codon:yes gene_type:complete